MIWATISITTYMIIIAVFSCKYWIASIKIELISQGKDASTHDSVLKTVFIVVVALNVLFPILASVIIVFYYKPSDPNP